MVLRSQVGILGREMSRSELADLVTRSHSVQQNIVAKGVATTATRSGVPASVHVVG
jgi:hypothetical protein